MATTITIEQWRDRLARMVRSGAIRKGLEVAATTLAMEGQRHAAFGVTNAPGGLRVRSGALRRSLAGITETKGETVSVVLSSGGRGLPGQDGFATGFGSVPYALIHEEGRTVQVPRHTRSVAFGRKVPDFEVGPYSYKMKKRPFLQPALVHISRHADKVISTEIARVLEGGR